MQPNWAVYAMIYQTLEEWLGACNGEKMLELYGGIGCLGLSLARKGALVTVVDLTFEAKQINSITWLSAQCFGTALLIYYIMARFALVPFLRWLEVLAARKVGKEKI